MTNTQQSTSIDTVPELDWDSLPMGRDRGIGWSAVREAGPIVKMDDWYYVTRREDVLEALRDPERFSSKKAFDMLGSPLPLVPLSFDPPEHTRFRKILQPFFSPGTLGEILPSLQKQAVEIIERAAGKGECEAIAEIAVPYPSQVFLTLFGLPLEDRDRLVGWKDSVIAISEVVDRSKVDLTPALELVTYVSEAIAKHRADPGADLLSNVLTGDDPLDDAEAIGLAFLFVLAGLDTVTSAMGMALLELARNPELRRTLRGDDTKTRFFIEEIVRLEPPAPILPRVTTAGTTLGGVELPEGTPVRLCIAGINRDGSDDTSGDRIVMDDKIHRHWGFGGGPHRCLGSHLARMELTLIVDEWLRQVPDFTLAEGFEPRIAFPANTFGLTELPLVLG